MEVGRNDILKKSVEIGTRVKIPLEGSFTLQGLNNGMAYRETTYPLHFV